MELQRDARYVREVISKIRSSSEVYFNKAISETERDTSH